MHNVLGLWTNTYQESHCLAEAILKRWLEIIGILSTHTPLCPFPDPALLLYTCSAGHHLATCWKTINAGAACLICFTETVIAVKNIHVKCHQGDSSIQHIWCQHFSLRNQGECPLNSSERKSMKNTKFGKPNLHFKERCALLHLHNEQNVL